MKYFYRDDLHLIEDGYEKLAKTISVSLLKITPNNQIILIWNILLSVKLLVSHPFWTPICHLSESDRKENILNRRNIFIVKPIKCSIQEVLAESFATPNVLAVDVLRTSQYCSVRLSRQQKLKSATYVNTSLSEEKTEVIMNVERGGVERKTSNLSGWTVKISRFKWHDFCGNFFFFFFF